MKHFFYSIALTALFTTPLLADAPTKPKTKEPAFDADLYRRDAQCFALHTEFLYWTIQEGALDYALKMTNNGWGPENCYAQGHFKNAEFNLDPGFRVALTFFRAPKYWELWTQYTRLTTTGSNQAGKPTPDGDFITGTWPQIFPTPMASARSTLHFNYNLGDLLFSRVFFPNPHLRLRLLGGGVVTWMDQFWKVVYSDSGSLQTKITNRWSFVGGGLRLGKIFDWYWFTDIYMTAGTTFAGLMGSYHNSAFQSTNYQPEGFNASLPVRNAHFSDVRPAFQGVFYLRTLVSEKSHHKSNRDLCWLRAHCMAKPSGDLPLDKWHSQCCKRDLDQHRDARPSRFDNKGHCRLLGAVKE